LKANTSTGLSVSLI